MSNSIVLSQTTSQDSVKCFTYEQARKIFKDLKRLDLCDSVANAQSWQITTLKNVIMKDNQIIGIMDVQVKECSKSLDKTKFKLKVSRKISTFGIPITLGGGFLLGYLLR